MQAEWVPGAGVEGRYLGEAHQGAVYPDCSLKVKCTEGQERRIKRWMGSTHFLMKRLENVQTGMSFHVLAYNMRRAINILGRKQTLGLSRYREFLAAAFGEEGDAYPSEFP